MREQGARHDLVDAVFALPGQDDLLLITQRVEALGKFLDTEDGANLLAGYKRAVNILRDEEKKSDKAFDGTVDEELLSEAEEIALANAINLAIPAASEAVEAEDFDTAETIRKQILEFDNRVCSVITVQDSERTITKLLLHIMNSIRVGNQILEVLSGFRKSKTSQPVVNCHVV